MARPKKPIDEQTLRKLGRIMCTNEEIAAFFDVSKDTIERRYAAILKTERENGRSSLRRFQYLAAEKGNIAMLIWLGKQYLGQSDKQEVDNRISEIKIDDDDSKA
ncbi:MAG: hypothetical protein E6R04_08110 [Spirochaetes bacterium]|nr:MAG: hypothetical protein E6R04_08110 [Spirochaetota bacterium]